MQDKELVCKECGDKFVLTVDDQEWYKSKGFHEPRRCKSCRALRRANVIGKEDIKDVKKKEYRKF